MKTWIGLFLTLLGLALGLGSALLDDPTLQSTEYASFLGISLPDMVRYSPILTASALVFMVVSFFLIFANREDETEY